MKRNYSCLGDLGASAVRKYITARFARDAENAEIREKDGFECSEIKQK